MGQWTDELRLAHARSPLFNSESRSRYYWAIQTNEQQQQQQHPFKRSHKHMSKAQQQPSDFTDIESIIMLVVCNIQRNAPFFVYSCVCVYEITSQGMYIDGHLYVWVWM